MDKYAIDSPDLVLDQPGHDSNTPQNKPVATASVQRPKSNKDNKIKIYPLEGKIEKKKKSFQNALASGMCSC